jgi:integrase
VSCAPEEVVIMGVRVRQKDGSWWVFIHHNRKRKAKKVGERKAAEEVARLLRARLTLGLDAPNGSNSPTLQEYAPEWLRTYSTVHTKPRTVEFYEGMLRRHILPTLGSMRLGEVSRRDVQALIADRAAGGLARNTLTGMVATLKALCNHAIDHQVITQNPAARLGRFTRGRTEKEARKIDAYTQEELSLLLDTAEEHYAADADLVTTKAWSGMRVGEVLGLQYPDIDVQGRCIEVRRTIDRRKEGVQITSPKSSRQRRVAIPQALTDRLARRRDIAAAQAVLNGQKPPLWVFPNRAGQPKDAGNFDKRTWYPLLMKAGLRQLPPRALRHTYASLLIQRGISLAFIQKQLGHASISTTVDIYGHLVPLEGRQGIEDLAAFTKRNPDATDIDTATADPLVSG